MQQRTTSRPWFRIGSVAAQFQPNRLSLVSKKSQNPFQCHQSHQIPSSSFRPLSGLQGWWCLPLLIHIEIAYSDIEIIIQLWPGDWTFTHPCLLLFHQPITLQVEAAFFLMGGFCVWVSALKGWTVRKNSIAKESWQTAAKDGKQRWLIGWCQTPHASFPFPGFYLCW